MSTEIFASQQSDLTFIALRQSGDVVQLLVQSATKPHLVGNIYTAKIARILPKMNMAFVDIGRTKLGVLPLHGLIDAHVGQKILVQVLKDEIDDKGVSLTTQISLSSPYLVYTPSAKNTTKIAKTITDKSTIARLKSVLTAIRQHHALTGALVARTSSVDISQEMLDFHLKQLQQLWQSIAQTHANTKKPKILHTAPSALFALIQQNPHSIICVDDETLYQQIQTFLQFWSLSKKEVHFDQDRIKHFDFFEKMTKALSPKIHLPSGGYLLIERTSAMTTIDVNSGSQVQTKADSVALQTNLEAVVSIARQLRLVNIGGLIAIDLIDVPSQYYAQILNKLQQSVSGDPAKIAIAPVSQFGVIEMTRQRQFDDLCHHLSVPCPNCQGIDNILSLQKIIQNNP